MSSSKRRTVILAFILVNGCRPPLPRVQRSVVGNPTGRGKKTLPVEGHFRADLFGLEMDVPSGFFGVLDTDEETLVIASKTGTGMVALQKTPFDEAVSSNLWVDILAILTRGRPAASSPNPSSCHLEGAVSQTWSFIIDQQHDAGGVEVVMAPSCSRRATLIIDRKWVQASGGASLASWLSSIRPSSVREPLICAHSRM